MNEKRNSENIAIFDSPFVLDLYKYVKVKLKLIGLVDVLARFSKNCNYARKRGKDCLSVCLHVLSFAGFLFNISLN